MRKGAFINNLACRVYAIKNICYYLNANIQLSFYSTRLEKRMSFIPIDTTTRKLFDPQRMTIITIFPFFRLFKYGVPLIAIRTVSQCRLNAFVLNFLSLTISKFSICPKMLFVILTIYFLNALRPVLSLERARSCSLLNTFNIPNSAQHKQFCYFPLNPVLQGRRKG